MSDGLDGHGQPAVPTLTRRPAGVVSLVASLAGTGFSTLIQLIFIPVLVRLLGIEAYGLIGFYLALQGAAQVLDVGLSPALSRELAGLAAHPDATAEARDLVRTVESGYLVLGVVLGAILTGLAPWLGEHWFANAALPRETIVLSLQIMGALLVVQWPISLYQSGLVGLERQIGLNAINATATFLANAGGALFLWLAGPTLPRLLYWLIGVNLVRTIALAIELWRAMPTADRPPRIDPTRLRKIAHYAAGVAVGSAAGLLLTQLDRVAVGRFLPLADLGRYSLAANGVIALGLIAQAAYNALFPRLAGFAEIGDGPALAAQFHLTAQIMAVVVVPLGLVLVLFARDVFTLWTGDALQARAIAPAAALLAGGSVLNALSVPPYALQLAARWTRLNAFVSFALLLVAIPLWISLPQLGGLTGAASVWLIINLLLFTTYAALTFTRLIPAERGNWLRNDVLLPVAAMLVVTGGLRLTADALAPDRTGWVAALALVVATVAAFAVALATTAHPRRALVQLLRDRKVV